jgi:cation diffusion facilitator family transporter
MLPDNNGTLSRQKIGSQTGSIGLISNLLLFGLKLIMGIASNSVAVLADSFNNLMDCVSSIVTIIGFRISGRAKDRNHPYGHGRMEYISGFIISMIIIVTAVSFGKVAVQHIISPQQINISPMLLLVTALAVMVKLVLAFYIRYGQVKEAKT